MTQKHDDLFHPFVDLVEGVPGPTGCEMNEGQAVDTEKDIATWRRDHEVTSNTNNQSPIRGYNSFDGPMREAVVNEASSFYVLNGALSTYQHTIKTAEKNLMDLWLTNLEMFVDKYDPPLQVSLPSEWMVKEKDSTWLQAIIGGDRESLEIVKGDLASAFYSDADVAGVKLDIKGGRLIVNVKLKF